MKKQKLSQSKNRRPYWSVLAPDPVNKTFHKPDNFISLIRAAQDQTSRVAPDSLPGKISGKDHPTRLPKDLPL